jgi:hypothetical protein
LTSEPSSGVLPEFLLDLKFKTTFFGKLSGSFSFLLSFEGAREFSAVLEHFE